MSNLFDEWSLYSRIVANNYMRHRDLSAAALEYLAGVTGPTIVVDLGCGDGSMARGCLGNTRVLRYVGIDTSADAIARACASSPPGSDPDHAQVDFRCEDLLTALPALPGGEFDLVLSSYCLHHLSQTQKQYVLLQIGRVLRPEGTFIWTDLVRQSPQTRDMYLRALVDDMRQNRPALTSEEVEQAVTHILSSDHPEDEGWMLDTARECGLSPARTLLRDEFYGSWAFVAAACETGADG